MVGAPNLHTPINALEDESHKSHRSPLSPRSIKVSRAHMANERRANINYVHLISPLAAERAATANKS